MIKDELPVLVLQGGGALGAYQAGAFEELAAGGIDPRWVAGISIGAINGALIAGNAPAQRVERLRAFWDAMSRWLPGEPALKGTEGRRLFNETSAALAMLFGIPGFFTPRLPPAVWYPPGATEALSVYDTAPLEATLEALIDFDRLNDGGMRLSLGAVNIRTGNFCYFDTRHVRIGPEHVMASAALPPGFPPIEIDGEHYWDGGLVSNTPLQYVIDERPRPDLCIFQIDLFSAMGPLPTSLLDVSEREKDIRYSSRTRLNTDRIRDLQNIRRAVHRLLRKLPPEFGEDHDAKFLTSLGCDDAALTIVHLIHRRKAFHSQSKDYEFSRYTVNEHWAAGRADVRRTLHDRRWLERRKPQHGIAIFDLTKD